MDYIYWDLVVNDVVIVNLLIVIALFTFLRVFSGKIAHIDASRELFKKDNAAFGLSIAGVIFSIGVMLSGTIYGHPSGELMSSAMFIAGYGILGIILMSLTRIILDKIALPDISLRDEIKKGNMAVAIADTANVLAAAIILRSLMIWVTDNAIDDVISLLVAFAISQVILTMITIFRRFLFRKIYEGRRIQQELKNGNIAFALSFGGRKIACAMAITIASNFDFFEVYDFKLIILPWITISIAAILILKIISYITERAMLFNVSTRNEILDDRNIAVGAIHGAIYIAMGLLISGL